MDHPDLGELRVEISATDTTIDDIDRMTRQLLSELKELDVESAALAKGDPSPSGTKSVDTVTAGSIIVSLLPTVLPAMVELVQAWATSGHGRTVKFRGKVGREVIDFEGSAQDLQKLLETLSAGRKR
jgi:hypothetical protein